MNRSHIYLTILLMQLACSDAIAAMDDTYICIAEESTGFYYENGSWGRAHFNVKEEKFIIRKLRKDELKQYMPNYTYGGFELGKDYPRDFCEAPTKELGVMKCSTIGGQFFFSTKSGRYLKSYMSGYWDGSNNNDNTPHLERGRCSKL